ncbi:MAG: hypothetical protein KAT71_08315 [Gammaproteobacteria bacterium]|nr:hypothetical protein [Gammaproteobacteria bacterium]
MYKLEIKRQDGSTYWIEYFNTQADADSWLAKEQTRKYWSQDFSSSVVYEGPTPEEIAAKEQAEIDEQVARDVVRAKIEASKASLPTMTLPQLRDLMSDLLTHLDL